ncbi:hypothetical protein GE21DRAFT_7830 [Neurospora crassa]|uniref:Uncharacterized protein n=1 Tax=Neurospora crassa (strain ATCC 24698 / 74-OR23-1A / CBS 708.71 / DSM 1257 / FGSC 987) TaxID=367110 RepID=Q7S765_NEUCR|nr:hypothetical protein NCU01396 [Neurospora crassa OR74A]EAA31389.1 hypothetical protein NCU01396 [Neurospora crassa OR74A]KHE79681.1 hypothetical protein GE21DRAFT_7830 [Neurospora crassa]|eukprot:XP_960625.1 hypothetical protein NCU01396 [Neurospora crassa OR74A]
MMGFGVKKNRGTLGKRGARTDEGCAMGGRARAGIGQSDIHMKLHPLRTWRACCTCSRAVQGSDVVNARLPYNVLETRERIGNFDPPIDPNYAKEAGNNEPDAVPGAGNAIKPA